MPLFTKSLSDLVKGIRANKDNEASYISQALTEIKEELKMDDRDGKAQAVQKLTHLDMLGYDTAWASFHIVEVMSQPWFGHRRIGYLASSLAFTSDTDVILLTTHLFKKAFSQTQSGTSTSVSAAGVQYEVGCAINCLSNICTPDLANDLLNDVYGMMNSSRPYIRKKAVLVLYAVFKQWPKALRLSFDRLQEKLQDPDQSVATAAVNVICELSRKHPRNYLGIVPQLFKLLTSSGNNWMLIKVVKLMGSLVPIEPRLAKKLVEPLTNIIQNTPAKSLLYECINTVTNGEFVNKSIIKLCLEKLKIFVEDTDQNLKYLGLLGLHKIMKKRPRDVAQHKEMIIQCLNDDDVTIRMRALDLITSMVTRKNLTSIVRRLLDHVEDSEGSYRDHVLERIMQISSQDNFAYISDFRWYIATLVDLTHLDGVSESNAKLITSQLMDVIIRVPEVRQFGVQQMTHMLLEGRLISDNQNMLKNAVCRVLYAAAWTVGEFSELATEHYQLVTAMLQPRIASLPHTVQVVFIQNVLKVFASGLSQRSQDFDSDDEMDVDSWTQEKEMADVIVQELELFTHSTSVEVQERAVTYRRFTKWIREQLNQPQDRVSNIISGFTALFEDALNPVNPRAQKKVVTPRGLDLESWINDPMSDSGDSTDELDDFGMDEGKISDFPPIDKKKLTVEDLAQARARHDDLKARQENDPFYLTGEVGEDMELTLNTEDVDKIPMDVLTADDLPTVKVNDTNSRRRPKEDKRSKTVYNVHSKFEGDDLAGSSEEDSNHESSDDEFANIDLSRPLGKNEVIPQIRPYTRQTVDDFEPVKNKKRKKKHKKSKKRKTRSDKKKTKEGAAVRKDSVDSETKEEQPKSGPTNDTEDILDFFDPIQTPTSTSRAGKDKGEEGGDMESIGMPSKKKHRKHRHKKSKNKQKSKKSKDSNYGHKTLCKDDNIRITFEARAHKKQVKTVVVTLKITPVHSAEIKNVTVHLNESDLSKVHVRTSDGNEEKQPVVVAKSIKKSSAKYKLEVGFSKFNGTCSLRGTVGYEIEDEKHKISGVKLNLPVSAFVLTPGRDEMDAEELVELLNDDTACKRLSSHRLTLEESSVSNVLKLVPTVLHVRAVHLSDSNAAYYGKTLTGDHIAIHIKKRSSTGQEDTSASVSIDVKSSQQFLSDMLLVELVEVVSKK